MPVFMTMTKRNERPTIIRLPKASGFVEMSI